MEQEEDPEGDAEADSDTSIIGCGASQYAAVKNTIRRKLPTDNILK